MQTLEQLISELCPNGVEFKKLKEIVGIDRGVRVVRKDLQSEGYPVYQNSLKPLGYIKKANVKANTPFIIVGGGAGSIGWSDVDFWAADDCVYFTCPNTIDSRFLYHLLLNSSLYFISKVRKASVPRLARSFIEDFEIPVPPLAVQKKIVEILDNFTSLTAELQAELQARQQQYEYYRNRLLSFGGLDNIHSNDADGATRAVGGSADECNRGGCKYLKMSELCIKINSYKWGKDDERLYIDLSCVDKDKHIIVNPIVITQDNAPSRAKQHIYEDDILFATTRPTQLRSCIITKEYNGHICSTGYCVLRVQRDIVLPKWIYYNLNTPSFLNHVERNETKGGSYPAISDKAVKDFILPIPPLTEQQRIVDILDRFEALINDIKQGLPAEIEARQQQYEYYRNKLLTFERLGA